MPKIMVNVKKIVPSPNTDLPPVARLASDLVSIVLEAFTIFVNIINRHHPIIYKQSCI